MEVWRFAAVVCFGFVALAGRAHAAGPLLVNGAGVPLVWTADPVPFNPDQGTLGSLGNAAATASVASNFGVWTALASSTISFTNTGALPVDVTSANVNAYLGVCADGLSPIIYDTDGSITDALFGAGASDSILGFAGPECGTLVPPVITEGSAVLNGKWIDGVGPTEIPIPDFNGVFIHEFGHYANLDHSQVNLVEAFDGNAANDDAIATMFPYLVNGTEASTLHLDDQVSISTLYPAASFATDFGTITGTVFLSDGATPFQGAYVIARQVGDARVAAVANVSGARYFPAQAGGPPPPGLEGRYEIPGLPAGSYTVEIEGIDGRFTGGSSVGPLDPPVLLPGPPEFYNGANEAGANPPDDPSDSVAVAVVAGATESGIDIDINPFTPPGNDDCATPTVIPSLPYTDTVNTAAATTAGSDPLQSCTFGGAQQNSNSVWYAYTTGAAATLTADTVSSGYDTILTAYTGSCGAFAEIVCNDDAAGLLSQITFAAGGGETVLFEVTDYAAASGGGSLVFHVSEAPVPTPTATPSCAAAPIAGCRTPAVGQKAALSFRNYADNAKNKLIWKWIKGSATSKAPDFGTPLSTTYYQLCIYDGTSTLISNALAPAGELCNASGPRPCWQDKPTGFKYKDKDLTPQGLQQMLLKAGATGAAKITVKGRGANLLTPAIPITQPVTVQLWNADGYCWEAVYSAPAIKNIGEPFGFFKDKAD